jgi:hypothetical protein
VELVADSFFQKDFVDGSIRLGGLGLGGPAGVRVGQMALFFQALQQEHAASIGRGGSSDKPGYATNLTRVHRRRPAATGGRWKLF